MDPLFSEIEVPKPLHVFTNSELIYGKRRPVLQVVKMFSSGEFEEFIQEWVHGYLKGKGVYTSVVGLGGSGDMGRDIIAYVDGEKKTADGFQCKHYNKALSPSDIWVEIGKICHYACIGSIPFPRKFYFVSPKDCTPALIGILTGDPNLIKKSLLKNWKRNCEKQITQNGVPLDPALLEFISKADFSVFTFKPILDVISEHEQTVYFPPRFGGGLKSRPKILPAPFEINESESRYVQQLFEAYTDKIKTPVVTKKEHLDSLPNELKHFLRQRNSYYAAESLRIHARDTLPENDEFEKLKKDIYDGVIDTAEKTYPDGVERVNAVISEAMKIPIEANLLKEQIHPQDKQGICHHLSNEDELIWVPKK
jgi:hypothetical protein